MARHRRVVWSEPAATDLAEIVAFVAVRSPREADRLLKRLAERAQSLATAPERGRVVPELAFFGIRTIRELVAAPYRIVYRIGERGDVLVAAVVDGPRDLRDVLLERLTRPNR